MSSTKLVKQVDTLSDETQEHYKKVHFGNSSWKPWKPWMEQIRLRQICTQQEFDEYLQQCYVSNVISWDIETMSLHPHPDEICGHCLAVSPNEAVYIPVRHKVGHQFNLDPQLVWDKLLDVFDAQKKKTLVVYNYKFEGYALIWGGQRRPTVRSLLNDIFLYVRLYQPDEKDSGLKASVSRYLNFEMLEIDEVPGFKQKINRRITKDFSRCSPQDATLYAAADPVMTLRLRSYLSPLVIDEQKQDFILNLEHNLLDSVFDMELNGVHADREFLLNSKQSLEHWACLLEREIYSEVGREFDIASPKQLGEILTQMGVTLPRNKKTGKLSTGADILENLASKHPFCDKIVKWRTLTKQLSTYIKPMLSASTGGKRLHFKFNQAFGSTGRFSSGKAQEGEFYVGVNAQNLPRASQYAPAALKKIIQNDLVQLEPLLKFSESDE